MWPFRKKEQHKEQPPENVFHSVICIPGIWNGPQELISLLIPSSKGEYITAGMVLMNTKTNQYYTIEWCDRDEGMKDSFRRAGMVTRVTDDFLEEIGQHKTVVYLSGPAGSLEAATHLAFAATAVLKAGGIGIKIETAGKAFEKGKWLSLTETFAPHRLYEMFVIDSIVDTDGSTYSCGMHNLGLRDTIISDVPFQESVDTIAAFGYYQIIEHPALRNNQTFSAELTSPVFRITDERIQPSEGEALFENPFGIWRLTKQNL